MYDPHLNIFHAYRGPTRSEEASSRQLEDNLTRALAITLNLLRDSPLRFPLLKRLGFSTSELERPYQIQLQVGKQAPEWPETDRRRLMVIHAGPNLETLPAAEGDGIEAGRADAVIVTDQSLIALESKLGNQVHSGQLERHCETLGINKTEIDDVTWSDLVRVARATPRDRQSQPVARFVLQQFEEYLQMNGFGGLSHEHFAFFALPAERRDLLVKDGIRRALEEIGDALLPSVGTDWHRHVLTIRQDSPNAGVVIEAGGRARNPHLTIGVAPDGLTVLANVELQGPYERFRRAFKRRPTELLGLLRQLGSISVRDQEDNPWRLCVTRRVSLGRPRAYHYYPAIDVITNVMAEWSDLELQWFVESTTQKPESEAAPQIFIAKSYPVPQVLESSEGMIDELSQDIAQLKPFFDWIGQPFR